MKTTTNIKTYSDLIRFKTIYERFNYLKLNGKVGDETFGFDRYINQQFYRSEEWKRARRDVIIRDQGNEMGLDDYEISGPIHIHHMNPITINDIIHRNDLLLNPEYLICVSDSMHKAIHYGDESILRKYELVIRRPNDTCPWRT